METSAAVPTILLFCIASAGIALASFNKLETEAEFQERLRGVVHSLYEARFNKTAIRDGAPSLEEVAIFFLEIIGTVVGLSWGAYSTILAALSSTH